MAKFRKGAPRPKGAGRKPGSKNKITRTVKEAFEATFVHLQRDPRRNLLAWATKNKGNLREFYKIAARFIPIEAHVLQPPQPLDHNNLHEVARRVAVLFRRARSEMEAAEAAKRLQLPEKVINS